MGQISTLIGQVNISRDNYKKLSNINNLNWQFNNDSILSYLTKESYYDETSEILFISIREQKIYHNRALFNILAYLKDTETEDVLELTGATNDFWFDQVQIILKPNYWKLIPIKDYSNGRNGTSVVINEWIKSNMLVSKLEFDESNILVTTILGNAIELTFGDFTIDLYSLSNDRLLKYLLIDGGESVEWDELPNSREFIFEQIVQSANKKSS